MLVLLAGCGGEVTSSIPDPTPTPPQSFTFEGPDIDTGTTTGLSLDPDDFLVLELLHIGETGTLALTDTIDGGVTSPITFRSSYADPVVVAFITTRSGNEVVDVRVDNVSASGATVFMEEPDNQGHSEETVAYLVMESGHHELAGGFTAEAGTAASMTVHRANDPPNGDAITFASPFASAPAVLSTLNTYVNGEFMSTAQHTVSATGFTLTQEASGTGATVMNETIGWAALPTGAGTVNGKSFEIGAIAAGNNCGRADNDIEISFASAFAAPPDVIAKGQSLNGGDGFWTRGSGLYDETSLGVYCEEGGTGGQNHAAEDVVFAAFANEADIEGYAQTGTWTSEVIDPSAVQQADSSLIEWQAEEPTGTSVRVETQLSFDGGSTWEGYEEATSGDAIPGLAAGASLQDVRLQIRVTLSSAAELETPRLESLSIELVDTF